jgi:hypothetical protein
VPWLLSVKTTIFDLPRRVLARSVASAAVEVAGAAGFMWGLHEAWAPLAGLIGGPLAVLIGVAIDSSPAHGDGE